jgi:NodT family efflux transporter outer membrane factor (OMF) lipoprotein
MKNILSLLSLVLLLTTCKAGPDYVRPKTEVTPAFKEAGAWKQAEPKDASFKGKWWEIFGDPQLNVLEEQIAISNQNVKAAEAAYRQARALVSEARASYFPTIGANASLTRSGTGGNSRNVSTGITTNNSVIANSYNVSLDASWEIDIWGKIRRLVESNEALAKASQGDLANAMLSAQAELAIDYLNLRVADEQKRYLEDTVTAYKRSAQLAENLYKAGVQARSDLLQAQVQLGSAQAQLLDVGVARAQFEHAIAILIGKAPASFTIEANDKVPAIPTIPVSVPSELLERRPDISAAEQRVAAANAQIGVAKAAYYPTIGLSASGGYQSSALSDLFTLPHRFWSLGPTLAETLFDGGLRRAQTEVAIAAYDQTVANYRQTVLGGFQEVEDNLAALRILGEEAAVQAKTVADAHAATIIFLNQYKAGLVSYLSVVTAQTAELNNELTALNVEKARLNAAATLIKAMGGGWDVAEPATASKH